MELGTGGPLAGTLHATMGPRAQGLRKAVFRV